jgi:hypothetical protein
MSEADKIQVGGDHYKTGGEEHWNRIWRLYGRGYFVGCITKYVERYHLKNGKQDLEKAQHFLQKLIELEYGVKDRPEYEDQVKPDNLNTMKAEGFWGDGSNHYRCMKCKEYVRAGSWREAEEIHGDCAGAGYVKQD